MKLTSKAFLLPVLVSIAIAIARFLGQVQGWIPATSGGSLHPLGVSWLPFVFGPLFAAKLARSGSIPRARLVAVFGVIGVISIVALTLWQFRHLADAPPDRYATEATEEANNVAFQVIFVTTLVIAAVLCAAWWRLALALICYAVPVRLTVIILTAIAKQMECDTHYTKFGPAGEEFDLVTTLATASVAQIGFWVPFAVVCGFATGGFFGRRPISSS